MTRVRIESGEIFLIDPRHVPFAQGESAYLNDNKLTWAQRVILFVVVFLAFVASGSQFIEPEPVSEDGVITEAEVTSKQLDESTFDYTLTLNFTSADGERQSIRHSVDFATFDAVDTGSHIEVRYLPDDPANLRIINTTDPDSQRGFALLIVGLLTITALFIMFFWIYRPDQRNRKLLRDGQQITGRIINCWPSNIGRRYRVFISYVFTTPDGQDIEQTTSQVRPDLKDNLLPRPGTRITVLYANPGLYRLL